MSKDKSHIDPALLPFQEFIGKFSGITAEVGSREQGAIFTIESVEVMTPFDIDILVQEDGSIQLGAAPPTQTIPTSFNNTFHHIRFTLEKIDESPES